MGITDDEVRATVRRVAEAVLADSSLTYENQVAELRRLRAVAHSQLAQNLGPAFNAALQRMPHDGVEAKRAICTSANETLRELGLAIRDPKTGLPAILVADVRSADDDQGRFRLEVRDPRGRLARTLSSASLVAFELCEAPTRQESLARGYRPPRPSDHGR